MKVNLGPGKVEKISLKKKWEEFMLEEGGQVLLNDGILMIPVTDYYKAKFNIKSVETIERMESELKHIHQDLIGKGFTEEEAKTDIKDRDKYAKYQKLKSEIAEVIVKEALEGLGIPGLIRWRMILWSFRLLPVTNLNRQDSIVCLECHPRTCGVKSRIEVHVLMMHVVPQHLWLAVK